jgi:hypothetical protein
MYVIKRQLGLQDGLSVEDYSRGCCQCLKMRYWYTDFGSEMIGGDTGKYLVKL